MEANSRRASLVIGLVILSFLVTLSLVWRFTPVSHWINFQALVAWQESLKDHPAAVIFVVATYLLGSLVLFPVTILNLATIFTFGPILGNAYSLAGWLCSAAMGYGIGHAFGRDLLPKTVGPRLVRLLRKSESHGFFTVLTVRLLPLAPFSIANLFVGASKIRFGDFFLASLVGRIPGIIILAFAGFQLENIRKEPAAGSVVLLVITLFLFPLAVSWLAKRFLAGNEPQRNSSKSDIRLG